MREGGGREGERERGGGREERLNKAGNVIIICNFVSFQVMRDLGRQKSPDIRQIDMDVLRTFRDHIMFRDRYGIK